MFRNACLPKKRVIVSKTIALGKSSRILSALHGTIESWRKTGSAPFQELDWARDPE
jgi:hypothetical protein